MADNTTARAAVLVISTAAEHRVRGCAETAKHSAAYVSRTRQYPGKIV